jgi:hypothetical protein
MWRRASRAPYGERVELGGGFFTPDQQRVVAALERYGMGARPFSAWALGVEPRWTWRLLGELRAGAPVPSEPDRRSSASPRCWPLTPRTTTR